MRMSTSRSAMPPTGFTLRSCSTRRSFTCMATGRSATSSSSRVPLLAASNRPCLSVLAPVKEPLTWPNSSDSSRVSGMAPQLTATKGRSVRGESSCKARAASSLPVPDSPMSSTLVLVEATLRRTSNTRCMGGDLPSSRSSL